VNTIDEEIVCFSGVTQEARVLGVRQNDISQDPPAFQTCTNQAGQESEISWLGLVTTRDVWSMYEGMTLTRKMAPLSIAKTTRHKEE